MKAAVYEAVGRITVQQREVPAPGPGEVLIRVARCGVCATDRHIYHGVLPAEMPLVGGHELAGVVEAKGDAVTDTAIVGRRVAVHPMFCCGQCHFCRTGRQNHCLHTAAVGVTRDGGFAQWVAVPAGQVHPIGGLDFSIAAMSEPLACVLWGLRLVGDVAGRTVLIVGAGPIGLLWLLAAKRAGAARVVVADRLPGRLPLAERLGAASTVEAALGQAAGEAALAARAGPGYDVAVDATGVSAVVGSLIRLVAPGGTVSCFGVCPPDESLSVSPYDIYRRDLRIVGGYAINATFAPAVALLRSGAVNPEPLVSHTLGLEGLAGALDSLVGTAEAMKVQVAPNG